MAITQKSRIKIRSGLNDDLPQLATGELGWSIDTRQLYIGNGTAEEGAPTSGNTEVLTIHSDLSTSTMSSAMLLLSSTIVPLGIYSPTANVAAISSNSADVVRFTSVSTAVNSLLMSGGTAGNGPTISSFGESNRDINLTPNGSGNIVVTTGTVAIPSLATKGIVYVGSVGQLITSSSLQFDNSNVGIGVLPSTSWGGALHALQIKESTIYNKSSTNTVIGANTIDDGAGNSIAVSTGAGSSYSLNGAYHTWYNIPSVTAGSVQTPVAAMALSTTYSLGIGIVPHAIPTNNSGVQLLSTVVLSDNAGTTYHYNNSYNDGIEKYNLTTGASSYTMTPTTHEWRISDGSAHLANDTITWLPVSVKIGSTGLLTAANGVATGIVTAALATYSVLSTDSSIISDYAAGTQTLTLPTASANTGRILNLRTITANTVISNASNVVPLVGGAASTAILAATAGKWAMLQSDGTNWQVMSGN